MDTITRPKFEAWDAIPYEIDSIERMKFGQMVGDVYECEVIYSSSPAKNLEELQWTAVRLWASRTILHKCVMVDPGIRGGIPVLRGTRITIAQIVGEVADGRNVIDLARAFDLDLSQLQSLFEGMAIQFDRPFLK